MNADFEINLLQPDILDNDIDKAALQAVSLGYGALCVPPYWVKKASRETKNTPTQLLTVIGYPYGYQRTEAKQAEIELALADGAGGVELVLNLSAIKSDRMNWVKAEIARFAKLVHAREAWLTVMVEEQAMNENELEKVCKAVSEAGADALKNHPTGPEPISLAFVKKLRSLIYPSLELKVFTQVYEKEKAQAFLQAGAQKICLPRFITLPFNK